MSYDLNVFLNKSNMPTPKDWQAAIIEEGFDVLLDSDFDVDNFSGFLPCPVSGEESGFEYYSSDLSAEEVKDLELSEDLDFSINFCIHSNPLELLSALAASSVLAKISKGLLVDPQVGGGDFTHNNAVAWAKLKSSEAQA
tara:strand:- start:132 stop:551 length:420 start_codon:yes stop_codon:yes gene_type:complete